MFVFFVYKKVVGTDKVGFGDGADSGQLLQGLQVAAVVIVGVQAAHNVTVGFSVYRHYTVVCCVIDYILILCFICIYIYTLSANGFHDRLADRAASGRTDSQLQSAAGGGSDRETAATQEATGRVEHAAGE